jgi:hypothetical protein
LLGLLDRLVDSGKSVIVIEHDQAVMAHADWIIDLGPGAGHDGGRIVFEGTPADLVAARSTLTGEHLAAYVAPDRALAEGHRPPPRPPPRRSRPVMRARDLRGMDRGPVARLAPKPATERARLQQDRQQKIPICRMFSTGATGLEPATSGVTGRVRHHDAWRRTPLNGHICRAF